MKNSDDTYMFTKYYISKISHLNSNWYIYLGSAAAYKIA